MTPKEYEKVKELIYKLKQVQKEIDKKLAAICKACQESSKVS